MELSTKVVNIRKLFNPFHVTDLFLYPLKTSENLFSGAIKRGQWYEMGENTFAKTFMLDVLPAPEYTTVKFLNCLNNILNEF